MRNAVQEESYRTGSFTKNFLSGGFIRGVLASRYAERAGLAACKRRKIHLPSQKLSRWSGSFWLSGNRLEIFGADLNRGVLVDQVDSQDEAQIIILSHQNAL